jgi:hypothetical protein
VLLLIVAVAGTAWYLSVKRDSGTAALQAQPLFPGFDAARVRCIIAENTTRDWHMRVEHDEHGGWRLTDPSAVPGNFWRIDHLLAVALAAIGREVPESERDPALLGFQPPRVVLEIEELLDGQSRHERVEIGGLDADNQSVNVRVRGHYLRVRRDLDTAIDHQIDWFKTDLALEFTIADVVRVRRSGTLLRAGAGAPADMGLELERSDEGWRSKQPEGLQLDPVFVPTWLQGLASIHHAGYFDELGGPIDAAGLEPPELRIELEMRDGSKQALRIGRPGHVEGQVWYALRENLGIVWGLDRIPVNLLGWALEDMIDAHVLRARREDVTTITLHTQSGDLYFTPAGKQWHVAQRRAGEKAFDRAVWADLAKVEGLLAALEQVELADFRLGQSVPETPGAPAVWVGVGGLTQGGWFGEALKGQGGAECVLFQRRGENACSLAPQALLDAVARPIEDFWSMKLVDIEEHAQLQLSIQGLGRDLSYVHNSLGKWSRAGSEGEAKELYDVLDALCFLRATRYLAPRVDPPWDEPVTVEFTAPAHQKQRILIGRSREAQPGQEVEVIYDKLRAVAHDQDLHARLLKILRGP